MWDDRHRNAIAAYRFAKNPTLEEDSRMLADLESGAVDPDELLAECKKILQAGQNRGVLRAIGELIGRPFRVVGR